MDILQTVLGCVFGGGLIGLVEFLIRRHDEKSDKNSEVLKAIDAVEKKVDAIDKKVEDIEYKVDRNEAVTCRARILRFNKELIRKEKHTHEEFGQCLEDCDKYERFCSENPDFKNNKAILSIENIKRCYAKCEEDGDFL